MATKKKIEGHYIGRESGAKNVVVISSHEDGHVKFYPRGGGSQYRAPVDEFVAKMKPISDDELVAFDQAYQKSKVDGDWFEDNHEPIPAFVNSERWNGWLCPLFEKSDIDAAIADGRISNVVWVESKKAFANFVDLYGEGMPEGFDLVAEAEKMEESYVEVPFGDGDEEYGVELYEPQTLKVGGKSFTVYPIGSGSWCWQSAEEPAEEPSAAPAP
jgi:hypothetical protein